MDLLAQLVANNIRQTFRTSFRGRHIIPDAPRKNIASKVAGEAAREPKRMTRIFDYIRHCDVRLDVADRVGEGMPRFAKDNLSHMQYPFMSAVALGLHT